MELLTIADIAKQLNLSQSTTRFYRDKYNDYLPCIGEGRSRRYQSETVEGLKIIMDSYKEKLPSTMIESKLQERFGIPQHTTAERKQQTTTMVGTQENEPMVNQVLTLIITQQKQLISKVAELENKLGEQENERLKLSDRLDKQDIMLKNHFDLVDEKLRLSVQEKPMSFLQRFFK